MDADPLSRASSERVVGLASAVLDDEALDDLLHRLTLLARHTVPASKAVSITVLDNGQYRTSNSTGPDALAIDEAQYEQGDGPCLQALRTARQVQVRVGADAARWPLFDKEAQELGVTGVLSTPLISGSHGAIGALNIYAGADQFGPADPATAELIGEHAAILLSRALALVSSTQLNEQLRQAVATREIIGAAKGILMQSQGCTRDEAFDILRRASQRENRKLREVAEEVVLRVEARAGTGDGAR